MLIQSNCLCTQSYGDVCNKINLDTLARFCKEWCLKQGYTVNSSIRGYCNGKAIASIYVDEWTSEFHENVLIPTHGKTEVEAVFKAAEWVAKKRKV